MIQFVTLDNIITDLLKIARGSKVSQSETISRRQLEEWVNEYRALLIKQAEFIFALANKSAIVPRSSLWTPRLGSLLSKML